MPKDLRPKIIKVGFTGPRQGLTEDQHRALYKFLSSAFKNLPHRSSYHHGDCKGSDEQSHEIVRAYFPKVEIHIHPPINPKYRAFCNGDVTRPVKDYLERDRAIVQDTLLMVATPDGRNERLRSGTWATIRYAKKIKRPLTLIYPDGSTEGFPGTLTQPLRRG